MWRIGFAICASCALISAPARSEPHFTSVEAPPKVRRPVVLPISSEPADPYAGVRGDLPIAFDPGTGWEVHGGKVACTGARDHCLPAIAWFWVYEGDRGAIQTGVVVAFTADGPTSPSAPSDVGYGLGSPIQGGYTAYRTVPATRANLVVGALAAAHPEAVPTDPVAVYKRWTIGAIERIDWDLGFVFLVGSKDPHFLSSTRIAVLSYTPGGKVTPLGDKPRTVRAADTITP